MDDNGPASPPASETETSPQGADSTAAGPAVFSSQSDQGEGAETDLFAESSFTYAFNLSDTGLEAQDSPAESSQSIVESSQAIARETSPNPVSSIRPLEAAVRPGEPSFQVQSSTISAEPNTSDAAPISITLSTRHHSLGDQLRALAACTERRRCPVPWGLPTPRHLLTHLYKIAGQTPGLGDTPRPGAPSRPHPTPQRNSVRRPCTVSTRVRTPAPDRSTITRTPMCTL